LNILKLCRGDRSLKDVRDVIGEVSKLLGSITNAKIVAELILTSLNGLENVRMLFEGKETLVIWYLVTLHFNFAVINVIAVNIMASFPFPLPPSTDFHGLSPSLTTVQLATFHYERL